MPHPITTFRYRHLGQPYAFSIAAPYTEGHQLTKAEAQQLNALRAERIQENLRRAWTELAARQQGSIPDADVANFQLQVTSYDEKFQFVERHENGQRLDSLQRECHAMATAQAPDGATPEEITALATSADLVAAARRRLEVQQRIASSGLEELLA